MTESDLQNGQLRDVRIEALDSRGAGTVRVGDRTLCVAGAAPGDEVTVRVEATSKQRPLAFGSVAEVLERGDAFTEPPCHHAAPLRGKCGGCAMMHIAPAAQREAKRATIAEAIAPIGGTVKMVEHGALLHYRNRSNFTVWKTPEGRVHFGSRAPRTGELVRMLGCLVLARPLADVAEAIMQAAEEAGIPIAPARGGLRHISLRSGGGYNVLVELITNGNADDWVVKFAASLLQNKGILGVATSVNAEETNAIRVQPAQHIAGRMPIHVEHCGVTFPLDTETFFQLNFDVAERMAQDATTMVSAAIAGRPGPIWDLYAGVGALGIPLANATRRPLYSAESVEASVAASKQAAASVGVDITVAHVDLAKGAPADWPAPAIVVVDPPRKGLSADVREAIAKLPCPVLYMSCSAKSFARDAKALIASGRVMSEVRGYDMLPQTPHVELLALFSAPE